MRGSLHLSAFVCTYFTHSEERARENVFLWGDNLKDNWWWALCKDLQCWKTQILKYTNTQIGNLRDAFLLARHPAKISNAIQIQIVRQSERWPVADDPSAKILYAQKENSYHLKPNPGHLINHIYTIYFSRLIHLLMVPFKTFSGIKIGLSENSLSQLVSADLKLLDWGQRPFL